MRIGLLINNWRRIQGIAIRDAARMIGVSASTLSRIERGEDVDGASFRKIMIWIFEAI